MGPRVRGDDSHVIASDSEAIHCATSRESWIASSLPLLAMTRILPRWLRRLATAVACRLIGDARVVRAIGQAGERLAAAEEEFRTRGIADWPMAGGFVQFQQRQALAHRHDVVKGYGIRLQLGLESMGERGVAARDRARDPHHVLGGAGLALARRGRSRALGAARKAEPVDFAD